MVQTDISQLSKECNQWREHLHSLRDEFNELKHQLQTIATKALSKDQLTDLEHFQNQLHIQLINIHDLKQAVKSHDRTVNREISDNSGNVSEDVYVDHERLYDDYEYLKHSLQELRTDFNKFNSSI
ncbi:hypothetical protein [Foetidibacter luteolus]|uniref:hypothetical protein n=1 Tax=Foetidibacter luteolus TaxID=2608880 RepID=UPI00129A2F84|nr:hypothetical protein [Foetidibacter luteolus]